jgi:hypothetical protein
MGSPRLSSFLAAAQTSSCIAPEAASEFVIFAQSTPCMKIINPLYDKAFKYLMENEKFARKVIAVILDEEVESVSLRPQETMQPDAHRGLTLFRLDFRADIRQADGTLKTVLIELQKSKFATDIQRFRAYLGSQYMDGRQGGTRVKEPEPEYQSPYPIITIYILGYNLDDLPYMAVTVNRDVINSVSKERIKVKSQFIELLTHTSHIIQIRRLPAERRTRLEQFFTLFDQRWVSGEGFVLDLPEVPEEFSDMARHLEAALMDDAFRRNLAAEGEIDAIFDAQDAKYLKQIVELQDEKKRAEERERKTLIKLARLLKSSGATDEEIRKETGLGPETLA